jgi:hypothetical protein
MEVLMTITLTQIIDRKDRQDPTPILQLKSKKIEKPTDFKGRLHFLLNEMRESKLLQNELGYKLEIFNTKFQDDYPFDLNSNLDSHIRENASMDLCYFDHRVIQKAIEQYKDQKEIQIQLLGFEDELMEIMEMILPKEFGDAVNYLNEYISLAEKEEIRLKIRANVEKIRVIYGNNIAKLQQEANACNEKLIVQHHQRQESLQKIAAHLVAEAMRIGDRIEQMNKPIQNLHIELGTQLEKVETLMKKMMKIEEDSSRILAEGRRVIENVLKKV